MTYEEARAARRAQRAENVKAVGEIAERNHVANPLVHDAASTNPSEIKPTVAELMAAGREFARRCSQRADSFAAKSSDAAFDIAAKVARFGSYASAAQQGYAEKLVVWAKVREQAERLEQTREIARQTFHVEQPAPAPEKPATPTLPVPQLSALIAPDRFARLTVGDLKLTLRNDPADLIWVKDGAQLVAVIDRTTGTAKAVKHGVYRREAVFTALAAIEVDPMRALEDHGQRTGRCGCCGRLLTDPVSVARGIGPICLETGGW
jgi:Family of unknown function (DUF6011)